MIEITDNLYIGNQLDYEKNVKRQDGWAIVHACKEPYHRNALGYTGRACSKNHPEYLIAKRDNRLILNLVDVEDPSWISASIVDTAMDFVGDNLKAGKKVLIHCNQGHSRSAGLGMLYLASTGKFSGLELETEEKKYKEIYEPYEPAGGMKGYLSLNWDKYCV